MTKEDLYNTLISDILPQIQEGLIITKDYFTDLFGRYVQYLIVSNSIVLALWVSLFIAAIFTAIFLFKKAAGLPPDSWQDRDTRAGLIIVGVGISLGSVLFMVLALSYVDNIIKAIYIPEIAVYEELKGFNHGR